MSHNYKRVLIDKRKVPRSEATRLKIVAGLKLFYLRNPEQRIRVSRLRLGSKQSPETIEKRVSKYRGINHWNWISDRTKLCRNNKQGERRTSAYFFWRKQIWLRDNFKCKIANPDCKGRIEAHHILSWRDFPDLRYQINNGITLCRAHHPRGRAEVTQLSPYFQELVVVPKVNF